MSEVRAVCDRAGVIEFLDMSAPMDGLLTIAMGDETALRRAIEPIARHGYDGETLIVAGVRDARSPSQVLDAMIKFTRQVSERYADQSGQRRREGRRDAR